MEEVQTKTAGQLEPVDYLIIAAGSDTRSYEILRKYKKLNFDLKAVYVFEFDERKKELTGHDLIKHNEYSEFGYPFKVFKGSIDDPKPYLNEINSTSTLNNDNKIGIDLSSFTKPFFFTIFKFFELIKLNHVTAYYTEPKAYVFNTGTYDSYRSSMGSHIVKEIPSFTGNNVADQDPVLVILLGFDGGLSREISDEIGPGRTILINGFPGFEPEYKDLSLINNERLLSDESKELVYGRANNPFEICNVLSEKLKEFSNNTLINLAPIGSKPMALGACIYAIRNENVRVVYPVPDKYGIANNSDVGKTWGYKIPLISE